MMSVEEEASSAAADLRGLIADVPVLRRRLRAGEVLFHRGDPGDSAQLVLAGMVGLEVAGRSREPLIAALLNPGDLAAPERLLIPGSRHETTGRALTDCEVRLIRSADLHAVGLGDRVSGPLTRLIALQTGELLDRLVESAHHSATGRVAGALCRLAKDGHLVCVSQDIVAAVAAVVRVTANMELRRLSERSFVRLERKRITLLDRPALERIAR